MIAMTRTKKLCGTALLLLLIVLVARSFMTESSWENQFSDVMQRVNAVMVALGGPHHLDNEGAKIRESTATSGKVSVPNGNTTFWRCKDLLCCPSSNTSPGVW